MCDKNGVHQKYKAVIFDMGGVVMNYSKMPYIERFFELSKKDDEVMKAWDDLETGKLSMEDGDLVFKKIMDENPSLHKEMLAASTNGCLLSVFNNMSEDENMAVVIPKLKSSGYLVGLLTNNVFLSKKKDESMVIKNAASRFDAVIESCREGVRKPNPKIYTAAASKLNVKPEECIYLDDFMENCKGAESVGMKSIKVSYDGTLSAICELEKLLQQKFL